MSDAQMRGWMLERHAAEKAKLQAEIERLTVKADTLQFLVNQRDIDIDGLRRDNERLRGLLREALDMLADKLYGTTHWEGCDEQHPTCAMIKNIDAALAGATVQPSVAVDNGWRETVMPCGCIYRGILEPSCPYHGATDPTAAASG